MKIGSTLTPGSLWVTVSAGIRRSGLERHIGRLGGVACRGAKAPETTAPRVPAKPSPAAPTPAERSSSLRVTVMRLGPVMAMSHESASSERDAEDPHGRLSIAAMNLVN